MELEFSVGEGSKFIELAEEGMECILVSDCDVGKCVEYLSCDADVCCSCCRDIDLNAYMLSFLPSSADVDAATEINKSVNKSTVVFYMITDVHLVITTHILILKKIMTKTVIY